MAKERTIHAHISDHRIDLTGGGMYDVRKDIMANGGIWLPDVSTWRVTPVTPSSVAWAIALADAVEDKRTATTPKPETPTMPDTETSPETSDAVAPTRRRINRAPDVTPAPTVDAAEAFKRFLETVGGLPGATAPLDVDAVNAIVAQAMTAALAPIYDALKQRPSTSVTVTLPDAQRTVEGAHHRLLPDLIKIVGKGLNVWLAGPSGSGKTHAAEQAANALGLTFRLQGAMTMAHELTGFVDAGGKYHETPFVASFRNGGLILLDELDAGSNEALLTLNAALANGIMALPSGEIIRRHADFRCIGAANTFGQGATADYVGRTRIDAAFLQRFPVRLDWQYDENLELQMTPNADWCGRVQRARAKAKAAGLKVLITPRATIAGADLISIGYTPQQAADMTYLADLTDAQRKLVE